MDRKIYMVSLVYYNEENVPENGATIFFDHDTCANAESWTELASVGEWYEDEDFEIEMMED